MEEEKKGLKVIRYYLKNSERGAKRDRTIFEAFYNGEIDIDNCKYRFFQSNEVPYKMRHYVTNQCFENWVRSLGYRDGL